MPEQVLLDIIVTVISYGNITESASPRAQNPSGPVSDGIIESLVSRNKYRESQQLTYLERLFQTDGQYVSAL